VRHLSEGESRTLETSRIATTSKGPRMEMRRDRNGFYSWVAFSQVGYDLICVIVDRLTNVAHFIPVKTTYSGAKLAELYMSRIMCLHGVPKNIMSDRGS
jgi:hypothetical protein